METDAFVRCFLDGRREETYFHAVYARREETRVHAERACTVAVLDGVGVDRVLAALDELGDACQVDATHVCL